MDRQGAGEVFSGLQGGQGGARMRWPAGTAAGAWAKTKNGDNNNGARARSALGKTAGFTAIVALIRLAQRRARAVMLSYIRSMARPRAAHAKEF
jgi:hypothetical protein